MASSRGRKREGCGGENSSGEISIQAALDEYGALLGWEEEEGRSGGGDGDRMPSHACRIVVVNSELDGKEENPIYT